MENIAFGGNYLGQTLLELPTCHSTNDIVASWVKEGTVKQGAVVATKEQTSGRGQRGNVWLSEPGLNLTFSIYLMPVGVGIGQQFLISQFIALTCVQLLDELGLENVSLKWPNDLYVGNKKIGGILIENVAKGNEVYSFIAGVGLNVNQRVFNGLNATSVLNESGVSQDPQKLLLKFIESFKNLERTIQRNGAELLRSWYLKRLFGYLEQRSFRNCKTDEIFKGEITGVTETGLLKIKTLQQQQLEFDLKEVAFIFD